MTSSSLDSGIEQWVIKYKRGYLPEIRAERKDTSVWLPQKVWDMNLWSLYVS
jgi:hypothetical protein